MGKKRKYDGFFSKNLFYYIFEIQEICIVKKFRAKIVINSKMDIIEEIANFIKKKYNSEEVYFHIEQELSVREKEVLKFISEGKNNIEIGEILNISQYTVKAYVAKICQKLAVKDRIQATVKAIRENLI